MASHLSRLHLHVFFPLPWEQDELVTGVAIFGLSSDFALVVVFSLSSLFVLVPTVVDFTVVAVVRVWSVVEGVFAGVEDFEDGGFL